MADQGDGRSAVPDFERMSKAYQSGLRQLTDELVAGLDPTPEEKDHLLLVSRLLEGVVQSYSAYWLTRSTALDTSTSIMYAESAMPEPRVLDVPTRSLVDSSTLTAWQARYLHGVLGLKHTALVTGPPLTGKSTLLNSLLKLIPVDQRVVAVDDEPGLPALKSRSFTVELTARPGTTASATAIRKAAGMKPTWIVAGSLGPSDAAAFFEALGGGASGLATMECDEPGETLASWIDDMPEIALHLRRVPDVVVVHMARDSVGRPRVRHVYQLAVGETGLTLTERTPS